MNKKLLLFIGGFIAHISLFAQPAIQVVKSYGECLQAWAETREDGIYRAKLTNLCDKGSLFRDKLTHEIVDKEKYGYLDDYQVGSFLNGLQKIVDNHISISIDNIKSVSKDEITFVSNNSRGKKLVGDELQLVSCDIKIAGNFNYNGSELIYIRKGKITKIDDYVVTINSSGEKKVKVDLNDLFDDLFGDVIDRDYDALGFYLGYSKHYPVNIGFQCNFSLLNWGIEYGINWKDETIKKVQNADYIETFSNKGGYFVFTPGLFAKYVTFSLGLGCTFVNKFTYDIKKQYITANPKVYFMMKPSVEWDIPLVIDSFDTNVFLCPRVAYSHTPNLQQLNCWEIGLSIRFVID